MDFWLGTHEVSWLKRLDVPLFVSRRRLDRQQALPRALAPWALDSGGFTELHLFGAWTVDVITYARSVARYAQEVGRLAWAAPQDWMCEPSVLATTGLDVAEHQRRTVRNLLDLRTISDQPFIPVLQGWTRDDYMRHVEQYQRAGVDLVGETLVGVGSVCRRQDVASTAVIIEDLAGLGLKLHGFGVKTKGLLRYASSLTSADSLAWSYNARRRPPMAGCTHRNCNSCPRWATRWRERLLASLTLQPRLAL